MQVPDMIPTAADAARIFGSTVEQARAQYRRNAVQLHLMAERAAMLGRKVNGYSEAELRAMAEQQSTIAES